MPVGVCEGQAGSPPPQPSPSKVLVAALWSRLPACLWGERYRPDSRQRLRLRPRSVGSSLMPGLLGRPWRPSVAQSAWSESRTGRIATTLITRAAASWRTGRNAHSTFAVGCPAWSLCGTEHGSGRFCLHNAMPGTPRCEVFFVFCYGFGWRRRQVMARTSSKSWRAVAARALSIALAPTRRRRWVSTSLAEPYAMR